MEQTKIYDSKFQELVKNKVRCVHLETCPDDAVQLQQRQQLENAASENKGSTSLSCSFCRADFFGVSEQREHYKLDWHRYNLKQNLLGREPLTEKQFDDRNEGEISSISGSDSENEGDKLDTIAAAQGKIFLESDTKSVFALYKCLLFYKKEEVSDGILQGRLQTLAKSTKYCVLMLGGGHFAGAIFEKDVPVLHKTFHCYTVRAGQGGAQSGRDNKTGGSSQPKSAGASLRRYNEQSLIQHVRDIIEAWKKEIAECNLIVYRASGPYNRAVLFDGKPPLLERNDPRLRTIPFSTRRATFAEVKRVYEMLVSVKIYDCLESATQHVAKYNNTRRGKIKNPNINRAKSREITNRSPQIQQASSSSEGSDAELFENLDSELSMHDQEISFQEDLQVFDDTLTPDQRKGRGQHSKKVPKKSKNKKIKEREEKRKRDTRELIKNDDLNGLIAFLENYVKSNCEVENDDEISSKIINEVLDEAGNTLLHFASLHERGNIVRYLLENDANPCAKNAKQQTPYTITQNKEIREIFKQFAQDNPQKYNYNKAQIPLVVLSAEEMAEKRKQQRKVKREKEKAKRKENEIKKKEQAEKERFLQLSDREKRAIAAERRILNQSGTVSSRCFLCGSDISGKTPFEYLQNRFCSIDCVKAHRSQHGTVLS